MARNTPEPITPELYSLRAKLVLQIDTDVKVRDDAERRIKKNEELLKAVKGALNAMQGVPSTNGYGTKAASLRAAIEQLPRNRFSMSDVESKLNELGTPFKISVLRTGLWMLAKKGEIALAKKGTNSSPAEYEKTLFATK